MTVAVAVGLVLHGLLHLAVWVAPPPAAAGTATAPFDPRRSWLLERRGMRPADASVLARRIAGAVTALFLAAGGALLLGTGAWAPAAVVAALGGLALAAGWFHPWLSAGLVVDLGVLVAALAGWPA